MSRCSEGVFRVEIYHKHQTQRQVINTQLKGFSGIFLSFIYNITDDKIKLPQVAVNMLV